MLATFQVLTNYWSEKVYKGAYCIVVIHSIINCPVCTHKEFCCKYPKIMAFTANFLFLVGVLAVIQVNGRRMELYREPNTIVQSFGWAGAAHKPNTKAYCYGMCPCPYNWDPLCGNDGKTYANDCMLRCQRNKCNPDLKVVLRSECEADDAWAHRSV